MTTTIVYFGVQCIKLCEYSNIYFISSFIFENQEASQFLDWYAITTLYSWKKAIIAYICKDKYLESSTSKIKLMTIHSFVYPFLNTHPSFF